jgi:hypothetical protein
MHSPYFCRKVYYELLVLSPRTSRSGNYEEERGLEEIHYCIESVYHTLGLRDSVLFSIAHEPPLRALLLHLPHAAVHGPQIHTVAPFSNAGVMLRVWQFNQCFLLRPDR